MLSSWPERWGSPSWVASALLVAGTVLSGNGVISAVLVGIGLVLGFPEVVRHCRDDVVVRLLAGVAVAVVVSALLVRSLPDVGSASQWRRWATGEGRSFVALGAVAIGVCVRGDDLRRLQRAVVGLVVGGIALSLPFYFARVGVPGFAIRRRVLLFALGSSHHIVGFTAAAALLVLLSTPRLFRPGPTMSAALVCLVGLGLSGSRSGLVGFAAGAVVVVFVRFGRRRGMAALAALLVGGAALVPLVPRYRTTAMLLVEAEFYDEAIRVYQDGFFDRGGTMSRSQAEANVLDRFARWGRAVDVVERSPLVGIGAFRINDQIDEWAGIEHIAEFGVRGRRHFGDSQPHNMYLHLLGEFGVLGTAFYLSPYAVVGIGAWRRRSAAAPTAAMGLGLLGMVFAIGFVSAGLLTTGLALSTNGLLAAAAGRRD
ncbi:MAG: O-antigen ligase family protein [Ilumatobacteraceae bacterium]